MEGDLTNSMKENNELRIVLDTWHKQKKRIVLVTGVFDILHHAHKTFLTKAKEQGDVLLVGIESDVRVKKMKGDERPINSQQVRLANLKELNIATHVFILPEVFNGREDYLALLQIVKPAVLAVSAHTPHQDSKRALLKEVGAELKIVMEKDETVSTTKLIEKFS